MTVDWGEGSPETISLGLTHAFTATHQYLDDDPSGTPFDGYDVSWTVTDDDTGSASDSGSATVQNVAPTLAAATLTDAVDENGTATLDGSFTDPGTLDTFYVLRPSIGVRAPVEYDLSSAHTFHVTHQYLDDDPTATASDVHTVTSRSPRTDTGSGSDAQSVTVDNVAPSA